MKTIGYGVRVLETNGGTAHDGRSMGNRRRGEEIASVAGIESRQTRAVETVADPKGDTALTADDASPCRLQEPQIDDNRP
jgi:hypothetical protein